MSVRFIDDFDVILLDMGNTFMFGCDRFGSEEDYQATYRDLGGMTFSQKEIRFHISNVFNKMIKAARDPKRFDDFGDVYRFLEESEKTRGLPAEEKKLLGEVFGRHEIGFIPKTHSEAIAQLHASHPLGLVSNIWSPSGIFEAELDRAGIRDLFTVCVWSSTGLSIKPSPHLFQIALDVFQVDTSRILYVGDNPKRDIAGAKAMGMGAVWIENKERPMTPDIPQPDLILSSLTQLSKATIKTMFV